MLTKSAVFTDIHFGRHGNSSRHNIDCLRYLKWFCQNVKKYKADHIIFMGDWFQTRTSVLVETLNYSHDGAEMLNALNIPIYFLVGNHDLYHRSSREVYSTISFHSYKNFIVIPEITVIPEIGNNVLLCPFLFKNEYPELLKYRNIKIWFGHFEFKGFQVTSYGYTLEEGPDHNIFNEPKYIFSGHFHKRQLKDNIVYIGNAFPMDFGDTNDFERGMMVYDHSNDTFELLNWVNCPKYVKIKISDLINNNTELPKGSHVKCLLDYDISYTESSTLKSLYMKKYGLRSFVVEEGNELNEALSNNDATMEDDGQFLDPDEMVVELLKTISVDKIDNSKLVEIYKDI